MADMTKEKLFNWITDLKPKGYYPKDLDSWYESFLEAHKGIREVLGDIKKSFTLDFGEYQEKINYRAEAPLFHEILNIIPNYLKVYFLRESDLAAPTLPLNNGISTTKHILGYATRAKLDQNNLSNLKKLVMKLGQKYSEAAKNIPKSHVVVSTDPKGFIQLGNNSFEQGGYSCFKRGDMNHDKTYAMSVYEGSFVLYFGAKDVDEATGNGATGRMVGFFNKDVLHFSNTGGSGYDKLGNILTELSKQLGFTNPKLHYDKFRYDGGCNYSHSPISITDNHKLGEQVITLTTKYSRESHPNGDAYANWNIKD